MNKLISLFWQALIITTALWILSKDSVSDILVAPMRSIAQLTALLGAVGYFISFILSSRLPFLEKEIPLDQAYRLHKIVGIVAGSGILLHVTSLITNLLPSRTALTLYLIPGKLPSYTFGIFAFYALLLMLLSTLYLKLPYHIWKIVHKITSYSIIFAALHMYLIPSDISNYLPLRLWILSVALLGLLAWFYRQFLYARFSFTHEYTVASIETIGDISVIKLRTIKNHLQCDPGQFAFFKFLADSNAPGKEVHPFTILNRTSDSLTIAVKKLGDHSSKFHQLLPGTRVLVAGPHGSFGKRLVERNRPSVWIAGGIGITPFYQTVLKLANTGVENEIQLFYTTSDIDLFFHPVLAAETEKAGIRYFYRHTQKDGRLFPEYMLSQLSQPPALYTFCLCGPQGLLDSMTTALRQRGVPKNQIVIEEYDFKSLVLT